MLEPVFGKHNMFFCFFIVLKDVLQLLFIFCFIFLEKAKAR